MVYLDISTTSFTTTIRIMFATQTPLCYNKGAVFFLVSDLCYLQLTTLKYWVYIRILKVRPQIQVWFRSLFQCILYHCVLKMSHKLIHLISRKMHITEEKYSNEPVMGTLQMQTQNGPCSTCGTRWL